MGRRLENTDVLSLFYERAMRGGMSAAFNDLAFYAKSFQKVTRLLSDEKLDDRTKEIAAEELKSLITKFTGSLEIILSSLTLEEREVLRSRFLTVTQDSFRNLRTLMDDFVEVKDYLLLERDEGSTR